MAGKTIFLEPIINEATENIGELESKMELVADRLETVAQEIIKVANNTSQSITSVHTIAGEDIESINPAFQHSVQTIVDTNVTQNAQYTSFSAGSTSVPVDIPFIKISGMVTGNVKMDLEFNPEYHCYCYGPKKFCIVAKQGLNERVLTDYVQLSGSAVLTNLNFNDKIIDLVEDEDTSICLRVLDVSGSAANKTIYLFMTNTALGATNPIILLPNSIKFKYNLISVTEKPFIFK